jgi:hypothetical protein
MLDETIDDGRGGIQSYPFLLHNHTRIRNGGSSVQVSQGGKPYRLEDETPTLESLSPASVSGVSSMTKAMDSSPRKPGKASPFANFMVPSLTSVRTDRPAAKFIS